jgi:hypothetical protein
VTVRNGGPDFVHSRREELSPFAGVANFRIVGCRFAYRRAPERRRACGLCSFTPPAWAAARAALVRAEIARRSSSGMTGHNAYGDAVGVGIDASMWGPAVCQSKQESGIAAQPIELWR